MNISSLSYWEQKHWLSAIDFLIVGAGLTGLQSALRIKESAPSAKVVVVDRWAWSQGASLKNAGFACFANVGELLDDLKSHNEAEVFGLAKQRHQGLKLLIDSCGADVVDFRVNGSQELFTKENEQDLMNGIDQLQYINTAMYDVLGIDNVFTYSNKAPRGFTGSITNRFEGQLNTGKLYECLWQQCSLAGVFIIGGLELKSWHVGDTVVAAFDRLDISCRQMILCTNAFAARHTEEDIVPARGQVVVTERIEQLPSRGLHMYDKGYYYWRDVDNRILLGGARNVDSASEQDDQLVENPVILTELSRFLTEHILGKEVRIEYQWSGIMGMGSKKSKTPVVKKLEEGVILAARLGGMGVALSAQVALTVQEMIKD